MIEAWDAAQVTAWVAAAGFPALEKTFGDNNITGDLLIRADHEMLKELGVAAVGDRIALLKAIYALKLAESIPFEDGDYVPESATPSSLTDDLKALDSAKSSNPATNNSVHLEAIVQDQALTIENLAHEVLSLRSELRALKENLAPVWRFLTNSKAQNTVQTHADRDIETNLNRGMNEHVGNNAAIVTSSHQNDGAAETPSIKTSIPTQGFVTSQSIAPSNSMPSTVISTSAMAFPPPLPIQASSSVQPTGLPPLSINTGYHMRSASSVSALPFIPSNTHVSQSTPAAQTNHASFIPASTKTGTPTVSKTPAKHALKLQIGILSGSPGQASALPSASISKAANNIITHIFSPSVGNSNNPFFKTPASDDGSVSSASAVNPTPITSSKSVDMDRGTIRVYGHRLPGRENESYKSFRVHINDNCIKIIPDVLKKYKVNDDWQNYALYLRFLDTERCLSFNERPLALVNKYKDGEEVPEFYIRHIKQVKTPGLRTSTTNAGAINVSIDDSNTSIFKGAQTGAVSLTTSEMDLASSKTHISSTLAAPGSSGIPASGSFLDGPMNNHTSSAASFAMPGSGDAGSGTSKVDTTTRSADASGEVSLGSHNRLDNVSTGQQTGKTPSTSKAVAVYEYTAQRDDEMNVVIGDEFLIVARDTGWFVVEKDGSRGWVPAGCLLEKSETDVASDDFEHEKPSITGVMVYDYQKKSPNELSISKGSTVTIHRKYQHWLLVDYGSESGWVPSCYISTSNHSEENASRQVSVKSYQSTPTTNMNISEAMETQEIPPIPETQPLSELRETNAAVSVTSVKDLPSSPRKSPQPAVIASDPSMKSPQSPANPELQSQPQASSVMSIERDPVPADTPKTATSNAATTDTTSPVQEEKREAQLSRSMSEGNNLDKPLNKKKLLTKDGVIGASAVSKLSSLLDTINPFMDESMSSSTSFKSLHGADQQNPVSDADGDGSGLAGAAVPGKTEAVAVSVN